METPTYITVHRRGQRRERRWNFTVGLLGTFGKEGAEKMVGSGADGVGSQVFAVSRSS